MYVWLSLWLPVRMQHFGFHRTEFNEIGNLIIFGKSVEKIQDSLKYDKSNGYFTRRYTFMVVSSSVLLRMRNFSYKLCRENQNTHFIFNFFPRKSFCLRDNVEKYCRAEQATDDDIVHAHCMLDT